MAEACLSPQLKATLAATDWADSEQLERLRGRMRLVFQNVYSGMRWIAEHRGEPPDETWVRAKRRVVDDFVFAVPVKARAVARAAVQRMLDEDFFP